MYKKIFNDIMREYDLIRTRNARKSRDQKEFLYNKYPRLKKLEDEMNLTAIKIAKFCLGYNKNYNYDRDLASLKNYNQSLVKEYNLILENIGLDEHYSEIYDCDICKDTGFVNNKKCRCFMKKLIEKYYDLSDLGEILKYENFGNFNIKFFSDEIIPGRNKSPRDLILRAKKKSELFIKNFDTEFNNLLFFGPTGLGKTFLCNCIAKEILDMGKTVLYFTAPNLFKMLDYTRFQKEDDNNELSKEKMIFICDLLIIDDLGAEYPNQTVPFDLFNIINTRILNKKPVVISTNLSHKNLNNNYADRIVSRLYGNYKFYEFEGSDIRLKKISF